MLIAIAQINSFVGDLEGNEARIAEFVKTARDVHHADLVIFPELAVTGYQPEDLLLRPSLHERVAAILTRLERLARGIDIILGYPRLDGRLLYNSCSLLRNGRIAATYNKKDLPNYGVFDDKRYFTPGTDTVIVELESLPGALCICEDLWTPGPARTAQAMGARMLISINASPYHADVNSERETIMRRRVQETGLPLIYVNMVGGQDEVVFDGGSMVIDAEGNTVLRAPQFEEGLYLMELRTEGRQARFRAGPTAPPLDQIDGIYQALSLGVRDYVRKNRFSGAIIGLSGGIDSALTVCIAADALGPENVEVLLMPSRYTADMSNEDSVELAARLGIRHHILPIEQPFTAFTRLLEPVFAGLPPDTTEENIQARCRGLLLMAVSNKSGKLVLTTGNKSEMAVGYATLYGDMAGGFAPLKDVSKTLVYALARRRNTAGAVIPQRIIDRPPSAELRADQKDQDSLPPYEILDPILELYIERDRSPEQITLAGFDRDTVMEIARMVDRNEYKRRQAAPGVKISKRAFGRDRRYPITSGYREE